MYHSFKVVILSLGWTLFLYTIVIILTPSVGPPTGLQSKVNGPRVRVKLDGPYVRKWTVMYETGRHQSERALAHWHRPLLT